MIYVFQNIYVRLTLSSKEKLIKRIILEESKWALRKKTCLMKIRANQSLTFKCMRLTDRVPFTFNSNISMVAVFLD
jgi:hypothetical protein